MILEKIFTGIKHMENTLILFPNQLFPLSVINRYRTSQIVMWEDPVFFGDRSKSPHTYAPKLVLNPLRVEYQELSVDKYVKLITTKGFKVTHYKYNILSSLSMNEMYSFFKKFKKIQMFDPMDHLLVSHLKQYDIQVEVLDTPMFLLSRKDIEEYTANHPLSHAQFFEYVKTKLGVLGGVKNLDKQNRRPFPKASELPHSPNVFMKNTVEATDYPMTHSQARLWFRCFLKERLSKFGEYEDAIVSTSKLLYHSGIAIFLNNGLLLPQQIVKDTLNYSKQHNIPIQSLEGFLRQIIGWREFCRLYYVTVPASKYRQNKFLGQQAVKKLDKSWYDGTTGIPIVDNTIVDAFKYGYLHHIRRLMIMANYMTLCKLHPDLIYKWMYEFSLDSWDWVMVFNCYSMGSYSDGGLATWKPYISSSAYVKRMSHEPSGEWETIWNKKYKYLRGS